jgi:hypothetical protein
MSLPLLNNPQPLTQVGTVVDVRNKQDPGSQGLVWAVEPVDGIPQGARTYINTLQVITSHAYVGPIAVLNFLEGLGVYLGASYLFPLPEFGINTTAFGPTEQDTGSFIQQINLTQDQSADDARQWICSLAYGPYDIVHELGNSNIAYGSFTPLDFPSVVKWTTAKYHRYYPTDVNGNPFINAAGDPLLNPPMREESTQILTIILWTPSYSEPFAQSYRDTTNSGTFLGVFEPNTVKCKDIDGRRVYTSDYGYVWEVKYEFEIRRIVISAYNGGGTPVIHGWEDLCLNVGFNCFAGAIGAGGALTKILINGQPPSAPVLLNPDGTYTPAASHAALGNLNANQSVYIQFQNYPQSDFDQLNIDPSILTDNQ